MANQDVIIATLYYKKNIMSYVEFPTKITLNGAPITANPGCPIYMRQLGDHYDAIIEAAHKETHNFPIIEKVIFQPPQE